MTTIVTVFSFPSQINDCILYLQGLAQTLEPDGYFIVSRYKFYDTDEGTRIITNENSRIFRTSSFPVDQETVKTFRNAPIISIPDANASAVKRRLSVQGVATAISGTIRGTDDSWTRKDVTLTATDSEASIKIKLWNAASTLLDVGHEGTKMAIKNLVVGTFRGQVNLLSTQETCIEQIEDDDCDIIITGCCMEGDKMIALTSQQREIEVNTRLTLDEILSLLPASGVMVSGVIVDILPVNLDGNLEKI